MTTGDFVTHASYSVYVALVFTIVRFRKIHRSYRPFLFIIIAASITEAVSFVQIRVLNTGNAVTSNTFSLVEAVLWIWQFSLWNPTRMKNHVPVTLVCGLTVLWLVENIVLRKINTFSSLYGITASFIFVFLAINEVNKLIVEEKRNLFKNSIFLICCGTLIFYTYRIFVESFYLFEMEQNNAFLLHVFLILACVNIFVNLLFAIAILWIPTRQRFSMPYS